MMNVSPDPPRSTKVVWPLILGLGLGVAAPAGFFAYWLGASPRASDVGGLRDLAELQARLGPLPACRVEYGVRGGRHGSASSVRVWACGAESLSFVSVNVPEQRRSKDVVFDLVRDTPAEPWQVLVDKDRVVFSSLKLTLEQLAPVLLEDYPKEARRARLSEEARDCEDATREEAERVRREQSKNSYPPQ